MTELLHSSIKPECLPWQSSDQRVWWNRESHRHQDDIAARVHALGWRDVNVIHVNLGASTGIIGSIRREGLDRVVTSVALGEGAIVISWEASRLSRTDKDWRRSFDICQMFQTLAGSDQPVLGVKGTLSLVEQRILRQRLQVGQVAKARRGELFKRVEPLRDAADNSVFHSDQRVCEAVQLLFAKLGVVHRPFQWFRDHDLELPANPIHGIRLGGKVPSHSLIPNVLRDPFYTGFYARLQLTSRKLHNLLKSGLLWKAMRFQQKLS